MDSMDLHVQVAEEHAPVLVTAEHEYENSANESIAPADTEEAPVPVPEEQYEGLAQEPVAAADNEEAPVAIPANDDEDADNASIAYADSYEAPVLANEDQYDDLDDELVAEADPDEVAVLGVTQPEDEDSDNESESSSSDDEEEEVVIEPFKDTKLRIEQLLLSLGYSGFEIKPLQHGLEYRNCVYALTSPTNPDEKYILRVPNEPDLREDDKVCETLLDDISLLGFLANKLPVPRVVAYSATEDNVFTEPYMLQTCLPGMRLDSIWMEMEPEGKLSIIEQYVDLIAKLEAINFPTAGTFTASALEPVSTKEYSPLADPEVTFFNLGEEEFMGNPTVEFNRAGPDLKALIVSHIDRWIETERKHFEKYNNTSLRLPFYFKMKQILDILEAEGSFGEPETIVLNHWDLEPRNIMVTPISTGYQITGIIDWDDVLALPRTLTRRAPEWIWDLERPLFTGFLDTDSHPKADTALSPESLALKNHFDSTAKAVLGDQYLDDAYGTGRLLRRIWTLTKEFSNSTWYAQLSLDLVAEWKDRLPELEPEPAMQQSPVAGQQVAEPAPIADEPPVPDEQPVSEVPPVSKVSSVSEEEPAEEQPVSEEQPVLEVPPISEEQPAEQMAEPEAKHRMGLWAKVKVWFRRYCASCAGVRKRL
ncbi:MAG: hypothetical protein Q9168_002074 [Polycauliona sp. 1 TL-2023]